jgi:hypothetical protein
VSFCVRQAARARQGLCQTSPLHEAATLRAAPRAGQWEKAAAETPSITAPRPATRGDAAPERAAETRDRGAKEVLLEKSEKQGRIFFMIGYIIWETETVF